MPLHRSASGWLALLAVVLEVLVMGAPGSELRAQPATQPATTQSATKRSGVTLQITSAEVKKRDLVVELRLNNESDSPVDLFRALRFNQVEKLEDPSEFSKPERGEKMVVTLMLETVRGISKYSILVPTITPSRVEAGQSASYSFVLPSGLVRKPARAQVSITALIKRQSVLVSRSMAVDIHFPEAAPPATNQN